ncbi:transcriptional regulator/repressor [uncultured phage cr50_1]|jgi:hypothetical protein|uniref:Transcriptional regulator/repressor n=1 Tax=uncultured phage cr50_1 TaxID=2772059 RepID=A0A7M1RWI1_9CAUD|nr:transcriptional regulator/repressor [uncultured phage cr50_1]QOR58029.1 transcriptional regulator/repressor [uncultured phage cr50_1]
MKLEHWIYFEKGEKAKLQEIMNTYSEEFQQLEAIQKEFEVDMLTASRVINIYNNKIRK